MRGQAVSPFAHLTRGFGSALLCLLVVSLMAVLAPHADAAEHTIVSGEYGKEGPAASGTGEGCRLAYQSATERLYLYSDNKIYGLQRNGPGSVTPLGAPFPLAGISRTDCGDPDFEVDNSSGASAGNLYAVTSGATVSGWTSGGTPLATPWPVSNGGGETCGVAVANNGEIWSGHYQSLAVKKFLPDGTANGSIPIGYGFCKLAIDPSNNDLYIQPYSSAGVQQFTAASGYTTGITFTPYGSGASGLAVNGGQNRLYIGNGSSQVQVYDTETGAPIETIELGGPGGNGIAVDEETDTLFVTVGSGSTGVIKELLGVKLPKATTGEPTSDTAVSGTADPAGAGDIVDCYFEWGTEADAYGNTEPCEEALPIAGPEEVHATLPGLSPETTYHYRLVLKTASPGSVGFGADREITPHRVSRLHTDPATNLTRATADLHGSFEGTGLDTRYFFEWGLTNAYGNQTPADPADAGVTTGPTSVPGQVTGLTAVTTYHYRVVAENSLGTSLGQDETFTTTEAIKSLTTAAAADIAPTTATLNGVIDPDGLATTFYFEYGKTAAYGLTAPAPPGDPVGSTAPGDTPVSAGVTELEPGTIYHYRVVGVNTTGSTHASDDQAFTTPQAPSIESFTSTNVQADSAELIGRINPNGEQTAYYFEYGLTPEYGSKAPVPDGVIAAGTVTQQVIVPLQELPRGTYHFRLTAQSKWGTTTTGDQTFTFYPSACPNSHLRQQTGAGYLPDCRAYELVSPGNVGSTVLFPQGPTSPVASSPSRFGYNGAGGVIPGSGDPQAVNADVYIATRTETGWDTKYVGIRGNEGTETGGPPDVFGGAEGVYWNLAMDKIIDWDEGQQGYSCCGAVGSFAPYVWDADNQPLGRLPTNVHDIPKALADVTQGGFVGDVKPSPDFDHYFFSSNNMAFADGGLTTGPGSAYDNNLETGEVTLVSKTPQGGDIPRDAGGASEYIRFPGVSTNGSHILMSTEAPASETHLYMTVDDTHHYDVTVGEDGINHGGVFKGMTADGERVYFTARTALTADDKDTSTDLYMWQEGTPPTITRVSTGTGSGNTDSCVTTWIAKCGVEVVDINPVNEFGGRRLKPTDNAVAADSGVIYFYSPELLDNGKGTVGARNLYEYREGRPRYVVTLTGSNVVNRIQVSPDGDHMAFVTRERLTPYDNAGHLMMYSWDPLTRSLLCVSCIPDGTPPKYDIEASRNGLFMSNDGRTFFGSKDPLVEIDTNGLWDTYEYVNNRPQLISSGTDDQDQGYEFHTGLIGVSADGVDVYFSTLETLVPQDTNGPFYKFYDARTGGGFQFSPPPAPCAAADECHGAASESPPAPGPGHQRRHG